MWWRRGTHLSTCLPKRESEASLIRSSIAYRPTLSAQPSTRHAPMPWYEYSAHGRRNPLPLAEVRLWHAGRSVRLTALVDSGAEYSLIDVRIADILGLERHIAEVGEAVGAGGAIFPTYRWPITPLEIQFGAERFPFRGSFAAVPPGSDTPNLLGRGDFFQRFIVQFWDAAELMNIDLSPDFPRPPLSG